MEDPKPVSFFVDDLIDVAPTLEELEIYLAESRFNAELAAALDPAENIDDSTPPPSTTEVGTLQISCLRHLVPRGPVKTDALITLSELLAEIANSRPLYDRTMSVRQALARAGEEGGAGRDDLTFQYRKKNMPAVLPSLALELGTKLKGVDPKGRHSGLYGFDLDVPVGGTKKKGQRLTAEDILRLQEALRGAPGVAAFGVSVSGDGLWVFLLGPAANSVGEHKAHWAALRQQLPPGVVGVTDENSDNVNRARVLAYDPSAWLAETVTPLEGATGDFSAKSSKRKAVPGSAGRTDAGLTDRDRALLEYLPVPDQEGQYDEWFGWVLRLKAAGFTASEVEAWSTKGARYVEGEVRRKWDTKEPSESGPQARARFRRETDPLFEYINPGDDFTLTDAGDAARLIYYVGDRLVVVQPPPAKAADAKARIYAINDNGQLSQRAVGGLVLEAARAALASCAEAIFKGGAGVSDEERSRQQKQFAAATRHILRMRDFHATARISRMVLPVLAELEANGIQADVIVKNEDDMDQQLSTIGTPEGVLSLHTGEILDPVAARDTFTTASTPYPYDRHARHYWVDQILPPLGTMLSGSLERYRAQILAFVLTHSPSREFVWEICGERSGKSTFANSLEAGLGRAYVNDMAPVTVRHSRRSTTTTDHNGDRTKLRAPARISFVREFKGLLDTSLVKKMSGGDPVEYRMIQMAASEFRATSHLWFQGNSQTPGDEIGLQDLPRLGISENDADSRAVMDRVRFLTRTRIVDGQEDKSVVQLEGEEFAKAVLTRLLEYTMTLGRADFPDTPAVLLGLGEQQKQLEVPSWERDWLPTCLAPLAEGATPTQQAHSKQMYEDLLSWLQTNGDGEKPPAPGIVGKRLKDHYIIQIHPGWYNPRKSVWDDRSPYRARTTWYLGWQLKVE